MTKAKAFSMLKCVAVLAVIALCSGLLLGAFNLLTYVDPLQSAYDRFAADTGASFSRMADEEGAAYGARRHDQADGSARQPNPNALFGRT